jgi:uncharacterized protein YjiK
MKRKHSALYMIAFPFLSFAIFSFCNPATSGPAVKEFPYTLSAARVVKLPQSLAEISGIIYNPKTGGLQAVQDEEGALYTLLMKGSNEVSSTAFGGAGDYEDLALVNNQIYVLKSNGDIVRFAANDPGKAESFSIPLRGKNDFETLLFIPGSERLLLFCKACKGGKKNGLVVWQFDLKTGNYSPADFSFQGQGAKDIGRKGLQPSAAAVHPQTSELYFLSSVNKILIVTDKNGTVKNVQALDDKLYNQPEGICFLPSGELVISNEKGATGAATLLIASPQK